MKCNPSFFRQIERILFAYSFENFSSHLSPAFVLGVGYKQQLGQYFNLGIQFSGRFLLDDLFDQVSDRELSKVAILDSIGNFVNNGANGVQSNDVQTRQIGNKADRDSYYFLSISLTYTIKEIICPFKYEKKQEK